MATNRTDRMAAEILSRTLTDFSRRVQAYDEWLAERVKIRERFGSHDQLRMDRLAGRRKLRRLGLISEGQIESELALAEEAARTWTIDDVIEPGLFGGTQ